ncbi:Ku protein, partial [Streptomyces sp. NPDC056690]
MRALWSGMIQFGLVVLPVKLFSATEEHRVRLREIHAADSGRERRLLLNSPSKPYSVSCPGRTSTRSRTAGRTT